MNLLVTLGIPFAALITGLVIYRHNGRKQLMKFDAVQFFYAFVLAPLLFIWLKSMVFLILRSEFGQAISLGELFFYDSALSLVAMYVYAFVVMHSLTKSFSLRRKRDPLYDLFKHSEYFHLWMTHIMMFGGGIVLTTIISVVNVVVPVTFAFSQYFFYVLLGVAVLVGVLLFAVIWLADPKQKVTRSSLSFMQLMKLTIGVSFVVQVSLFFVLGPAFNAAHVVYWFILVVTSAQVTVGLFMYKSVKAQSLFQRIFNSFKHKGWNFRVQLFSD